MVAHLPLLRYRYDAKEGFLKMKAGVRDLNRDVWGQVLRAGRLSKHSGCAEGTKIQPQER